MGTRLLEKRRQTFEVQEGLEQRKTEFVEKVRHGQLISIRLGRWYYEFYYEYKAHL